MAAAASLVPVTLQTGGGRILTFSPTAPTATQSKNLVNTISKNLGCGVDTTSILKEFEWQKKTNTIVKDTVTTQISPMIFAIMKGGSPFIQIVHSVGKFGGDLFNPAEYQGWVIYLVGDK